MCRRRLQLNAAATLGLGHGTSLRVSLHGQTVKAAASDVPPQPEIHGRPVTFDNGMKHNNRETSWSSPLRLLVKNFSSPFRSFVSFTGYFITPPSH